MRHVDYAEFALCAEAFLNSWILGMLALVAQLAEEGSRIESRNGSHLQM